MRMNEDPNIDIRIAERQNQPGSWGVEAFDPKTGKIESAVFCGLGSEARAVEYTLAKYGPN